MVGINLLAQVRWPRSVGICWLAMVGWPRLVGIGLLAWLVGPGWLAQHGWPRYVGWLAGFVGSKYFLISSWYPGPGSPRIFEPIFFVGILGEPDQRYLFLTHGYDMIYFSKWP